MVGGKGLIRQLSYDSRRLIPKYTICNKISTSNDNYLNQILLANDYLSSIRKCIQASIVVPNTLHISIFQVEKSKNWHLQLYISYNDGAPQKIICFIQCYEVWQM